MKIKDCSDKVKAAVMRIAANSGKKPQEVLDAYVRAAKGAAVNRRSLFLA